MLQIISSLVGHRVVQVAYHVPDVVSAAERFSRVLGWGPFFVVKHIPLTRCIYRDRVGVFDHSSAYGQAGDVMVELVMQHSNEPSAIRDMYAAHQTGLHHMACFTDDLDAELARYGRDGYPTAMYAQTSFGLPFAMVDTRRLVGHMLELYPRTDSLGRFYSMVKEASVGWDGAEPVRYL
jgi:hypothetical protein